MFVDAPEARHAPATKRAPVRFQSRSWNSLKHWFVLVLVLGWACLAWVQLRPTSSAADWNGWRQADTQTIALNLAKPHSSLLLPQISWGGDGPGYVEAECQIYTALVALLMRAFGEGEWPGQLLSLVSVAAAGWVLYRDAEARHGWVAAIAGLFAFLQSKSIPHLATTIQPDSLSLLGFAGAWVAFRRYAESGSRRALVTFTCVGTLAMLVKPTAAQLGVATFVLLLLGYRERLKSRDPWLAWTVMLTVLGAYLVVAHRIEVQYGNTFGMLGGRDSKTPAVAAFLHPSSYRDAVRNFVGWGIGFGGLFTACILVLSRRLSAPHWALLAGNVALTLIALRYVAGSGNYYYAPAAVLACEMASTVTVVILQAAKRREKSVFGACAVSALILLFLLGDRREFHIRAWDRLPNTRSAQVTAVGMSLASRTSPGDLVVVRSPEPEWDSQWHVANNYFDPRIFYLSSTHGWVVAVDRPDTTLLARAVTRGARFFADPMPDGDPILDGWLSTHAKLVEVTNMSGRIWELNPRG
jgi:hypothetical protein